MGLLKITEIYLKVLKLKGIKFNSETDTEIIPHLIGLEIEQFFLNGLSPNEQTLLLAVQKVLTLLEGYLCHSSDLV